MKALALSISLSIKIARKLPDFPHKTRILINLRSCLYTLEKTEAERQGQKLPTSNLAHIEDMPSFFDTPASPPVPPMGCWVFQSAGPPWYGAGCKLPAGHDGDHDFGTQEEARAAFYGQPSDPKTW